MACEEGGTISFKLYLLPFFPILISDKLSPVFKMNNVRGKTDTGIYHQNGRSYCWQYFFYGKSLQGFSVI